MELKLSRDLFLPNFYPYIKDYSHRWELYMGSAGSGKSYSIMQKLIIRALTEDITILVCRRYASTIKNSCFSLCTEILRKWHLVRADNKIVKINESDFSVKFPMTGSKIVFLGLDDENKLLSINDIGTIFVEEAYEITQDMVEQLNLRLRGHNKNQQLILAWNPINKNHWLFTFCETPPENSIYHHSTYKENPFLSPENRKAIEELQTRNPQKYRVYGLGEWGTDTDGLVFKNWKVENFNKEEIAKKFEHRSGMDFGFNDPSAIVSSFYDKDNKTIYVADCFYKTGQTLDNLYSAILNLNLKKARIQADSAEPRTIDFFRRKGLNVVPCVKGQNSVQARILFLQNHTIVISPECKAVIEEFENFSYIKDKKTNQFTDDTTHEFSHSVDALGYAFSDLYTKGRLKTLDKDVLGL